MNKNDFRAYSPKWGVMCYHGYGYSIDVLEGTIRADARSPCDDSGIILMQFTGFVDKNGTKIYEDDIIRISNDSYRLISIPGYPERTKQICRVGFSHGAFMFGRGTLINELDTYLFLWVRDCEVIGNIHMHPELMAAS